MCGDGFGAPHLSVGEGGGAAKGWMWAGWGLSVLGMQEPKGNLQEKGRRRNSEGKEGGRMHCHRCPAPWGGTEQEVCTHIKHQGEHGEWDEHSWKFAGCWEWDTRSTWGSPASPCSRLPPPCTECPQNSPSSPALGNESSSCDLPKQGKGGQTKHSDKAIWRAQKTHQLQTWRGEKKSEK